MTKRQPHTRKLDLKNGRIDMSHGSGGKAMAQLVDELFFNAFANPLLEQRNDQAMFEVSAGRMVMTTDSYVVSPLFFPGGDIGSLAVHGTVNDIAMAGAKPLYLTAGFIIEEGFPLRDLDRIVTSMAEAARAAGVAIVTGDTKVVERGKGDGVFINTTGIGMVPPGVIPVRRPRPSGRRDPGQRHHRRPWRRHHVHPRGPELRHQHPVGQRGAARSRGRHGRGGSRHPRHARSDPRRAGDYAE